MMVYIRKCYDPNLIKVAAKFKHFTFEGRGLTGCLVISSFQIPGHFQVLQNSFSRSYETKKIIRLKLLYSTARIH